MGIGRLLPGMTRGIPGGVIAFQSAVISQYAGEPSVYRFVLQFGAPNAAAQVGNWLFSQLYNTAAALHLDGVPLPVDHKSIIGALSRLG